MYRWQNLTKVTAFVRFLSTYKYLKIIKKSIIVSRIWWSFDIGAGWPPWFPIAIMPLIPACTCRVACSFLLHKRHPLCSSGEPTPIMAGIIFSNGWWWLHGDVSLSYTTTYPAFCGVFLAGETLESCLMHDSSHIGQFVLVITLNWYIFINFIELIHYL